MRAVRDLKAVLQDGEPAVWSAVAVERMKAIDGSPWKYFRGTGLDEIMLRGLVNTYVGAPKVIKKQKGMNVPNETTTHGGEKKTARGYTRAAIESVTDDALAAELNKRIEDASSDMIG